MKINVGLSQKRGLPNYGSAGASCHVEVELDGAMLAHDPARFQQRVREAFAACRQAVDEELARTPPSCDDGDQRNGRSGHNRLPAQSGGAGSPRPATANQVNAIRAITHRAGIDLAAELSQRYGVQSPDALNMRQASQLIDALKGVPSTA